MCNSNHHNPPTMLRDQGILLDEIYLKTLTVMTLKENINNACHKAPYFLKVFTNGPNWNKTLFCGNNKWLQEKLLSSLLVFGGTGFPSSGVLGIGINSGRLIDFLFSIYCQHGTHPLITIPSRDLHELDNIARSLSYNKLKSMFPNRASMCVPIFFELRKMLKSWGFRDFPSDQMCLDAVKYLCSTKESVDENTNRQIVADISRAVGKKLRIQGKPIPLEVSGALRSIIAHYEQYSYYSSMTGLPILSNLKFIKSCSHSSNSDNKDLYQIYRIVLEEIQYWPRVNTISDLINLMYNEQYVAFRKQLLMWMHYFRKGDYDAVDRVRKEVRQANEALRKLNTSKRVGKWLFFMSLPVSFASLISGAPIGLALTAIGLPYTVSSWIKEKRYAWALFGR